MEGMKHYPDKYFDLAIVDPPYGINYDTMAEKSGGTRSKNGATYKKKYKSYGWDKTPPKDEYFEELFRVSKKAIIWGGNYFKQLSPFRHFICWDKRVNDNLRRSFADCELAYMTDNMGASRMFRYVWDGMIQGDMKNKEQRFHPTQKPIALYKWILQNYAKPGDIILDTHVGSASSLIACEELGFDYVGFEINKEYYQKARARINEFNQQMRMF